MKNKKSLPAKDIYNFISIMDYTELYVIEASYRCRHPEISKKPMKKPYYALHLILKGSGHLITKTGKHELNKNSIFIRFPSEEITYYDNENDPWSYIFITFQGTKVPVYMERLGFNQENRVFQSTSLITSIFCNLIADCKDNMPSSDIIANGTLYNLFAQLAIQRGVKQYEKQDIQHSYIIKAMEYINANYLNSDLSGDEVAKYLNLNVDYFLRIFKTKMGTPFSKYLISKRISYAISMIDKGETSVSKIAYSAGYLSPAYFTTAFKKAFGILPSEYIKCQNSNQ